MKLFSGKNIGIIRGFLMIKRTCKWNAWVRDFTAKIG